MNLKNAPGIIVIILIGILIGLGAYSFIYAKGYSYLSDDPKACINCHIMQANYDSWSKSGHQYVAKCNDCHLPHGNIAAKYAVKALNGFNHGWAFTFQNFHEPIQIKDLNRKVALQSCLNCHQPMVQAMDIGAHKGTEENVKNCLHCHRGVGHGQ
ncbi:cytochrome c nitrite reductase small subunit [Bdellovibrio sp. HCB288]|uniref:cytochrome c nitrite reductase small subunit n=1 Tax=Bdellovibrio sp. HCB288 TaxID=3394355 RepID=UPI0039B3F1C1